MRRLRGVVPVGVQDLVHGGQSALRAYRRLQPGAGLAEPVGVAAERRAVGPTNVHAFQFAGARYAYDPVSSARHRLSAAAHAALKSVLSEGWYAARASATGERLVALDELAALRASGALFTPDRDDLGSSAPRGLRALCLNVAHDCNMACDYCFSGDGAYGGRRAQAAGKRVTFTLTTNALLLRGGAVDFVDREMDNVVLSCDGRPEVHDRRRRLRCLAVVRRLEVARRVASISSSSAVMSSLVMASKVGVTAAVPLQAERVDPIPIVVVAHIDVLSLLGW